MESYIDVDMDVDTYGIINVDIVIAMDIDNHTYTTGSRCIWALILTWAPVMEIEMSTNV